MTGRAIAAADPRPDRYKWVALSNTTLGMFMATLDGSIVIISMPAIFRGIKLDPLDAGNIAYLLWMVLGYLLVSAIFVVPLGRLGDMFGRVRIYNMGFLLFSIASLVLSLDPLAGRAGALWLIFGRMIQALGGAVLMSNSAAILTDAFPVDQRGMALGVNQIAGLSGQFLGLLAGGLLAAIDWRAVFWVNVPIGIVGTIWSYRSLRETGERHRTHIDWLGNITFTAGMAAVLIAITNGIQPYHGHATGWSDPVVLAELFGGIALLVIFCIIETRVAEPMVRMGLFRIRAFATGNLAALMVAMARGGLQFMLIIWLQGIWLPLHGYSYADTPLWAGIYLLPLTVGFLAAGPLCGHLADRYGARPFATGGLLLVAASFIGMYFLPVDFNYDVFALLIGINGVGQGMFSAPNTSAIMNSVPAAERGAASGVRSTFQNSGTALSIGIFFALMTAGLASSLPDHLTAGLTAHGVPSSVAHHVGTLPPVSSLFAAFLGTNPIGHLLAPTGVLATLPAHAVATLTGTNFFPRLIAASFHDGLAVVFAAATAMSLIGAGASLLRGKRFVHDDHNS
jgi:MFS family permease